MVKWQFILYSACLEIRPVLSSKAPVTAKDADFLFIYFNQKEIFVIFVIRYSSNIVIICVMLGN